MRKHLGVVSGVVLALTMSAPVLAARPATPGCLGDSVNTAAEAGADFGQFVASVAKDVRGVGEEVQFVLAGEFPDEGFPNTCND